MSQAVLNFSDLDLDKSYTYADYLLWKFDEQVELIKGKIFKMSPAPNTSHMKISQKLNFLILSNFRNKSCQAFTSPFDIVLEKSKNDKKIVTVVQPDLGIICDTSKLDPNKCNGAPDLVIEILSPGNSKKEMKIKYELYEENGVLEYWVVDPDHETISLFSLKNSKFIPHKPYTTEESFNSPLFPELEINVENIFAELNK